VEQHTAGEGKLPGWPSGTSCACTDGIGNEGPECIESDGSARVGGSRTGCADPSAAPHAGREDIPRPGGLYTRIVFQRPRTKRVVSMDAFTM